MWAFETHAASGLVIRRFQMESYLHNHLQQICGSRGNLPHPIEPIGRPRRVKHRTMNTLLDRLNNALGSG